MKKCALHNICTGCSLWEISYEQEQSEKIQKVKNILTEVNFKDSAVPVSLRTAGYSQLRDRADIQWRKGIGWGFLNSKAKFKNANEKEKDKDKDNEIDNESEKDNDRDPKIKAELIPIIECPLFSDELQKFYNYFQKIELPYAKASARLRVSPDGKWGLWLDLPNVDIKDLLTHQLQILNQFKPIWKVEIGQRRKTLLAPEDPQAPWKLSKLPQHEVWFETTNLKNAKLPLYSLVGGFTQVGMAINKILVSTVLELLQKYSKNKVSVSVQTEKREFSENKSTSGLIDPQFSLNSSNSIKLDHPYELNSQSIVELGAGIGNFTFSFLTEGYHVETFENDSIAVQALEYSLQNHYKEFQNYLKIHNWDFLKAQKFPFAQKGILFVDPPRSGLGQFLKNPFWQSSGFEALIYVSCSVDSWRKDLVELNALGFRLDEVVVVDQFPRTEHMELVSLFKTQSDSK